MKSIGCWSRVKVLVTILVIALVAAACGNDDGEVATTSASDTVVVGETVKIGVIGAESGFASVWGIPWRVSWQMAAEEVNARGGLDVDGTRHQVEILFADDKYDPTVGRSAAERFINLDNVTVLATVSDTTGEAILALADANNVLVVSAFYTASLMQTDHSFGTINTYWETAEAYLATIKDLHPEAETVAMLNMNFSWAIGMANAEEAAAPGVGMTWLGAELIEPGPADWAPVVSAVMSKNPDVFSIGCFGADVGTIIMTARELGYGGVLASNCQDDIAVPFEKAGPRAAEGYIQTEDAHYPPNPELAALRAEYEAREGQWLGSVARYWYAPRALFAAIEAAGTVDDTQVIATKLEQVEFSAAIMPGEWMVTTGVPYQGDSTFNKAHQLRPPFVINTVENGEITTINVFQAD